MPVPAAFRSIPPGVSGIAVPKNSGGGLFDLHLHDIDYLCYLFGKVKQVYAVGRKNSVGCWNHVATSLTFENGMEATAEGILEMPSGFPFTTELNVVGDKKAYCYHMGAGANLENIAAASRSTTVYGDGKAETLAIDPYDAYQKDWKISSAISRPVRR